MIKQWKSEGDGKNNVGKLALCGNNVIFEDGVRIFHPENIYIGNNVYIGHDTILKGYYKGNLVIGNNVWIGQQCFIHAGGGVKIGNNVGIGPQVKIHAARHIVPHDGNKILFSPIELCPISIEDDANLGIGCMIMGNVTISKGMRVGTNAVVTKNFPELSIVAGIPAKILRTMLKDSSE